MIGELIDKLFVKLSGGKPDPEPGISLSEVLAKITPYTENHQIYVVPMAGKPYLYVKGELTEGIDMAKAIWVAYQEEGVATWDTEVPAKYMCEKLAEFLDSHPIVQLSRNPEIFVGYYVSIQAA